MFVFLQNCFFIDIFFIFINIFPSLVLLLTSIYCTIQYNSYDTYLCIVWFMSMTYINLWYVKLFLLDTTHIRHSTILTTILIQKIHYFICQWLYYNNFKWYDLPHCFLQMFTKLLATLKEPKSKIFFFGISFSKF